jgi:hypothetical protein
MTMHVELRRTCPTQGPALIWISWTTRVSRSRVFPPRGTSTRAPLSFADETGDFIGDDDLEARIMEAFEDDDRVDLATLELTIRDGVAVLDGAVDSEEDRRHLIGFLRRVKGVRDVEADGLLARGVDSHLPRDVKD